MIRTTAAATTDSSGSCSQVGRTAPAPTINTRGLRKTLGSLVAVDGLDLTIRSGEVVAFLGPSGAGKSTTLDMVLGLTLSDIGAIEPLGTPPDHVIQADRVGIISQDGGLLDDFTVEETLRVIASMGPRHCSNISHAPRLDDVVDQASLGELLTHEMSRCSGDERQRLRLALALLPDPDLLVADEPTAGIGVSARIAFWETIHIQTRHDRTVLFATRYLEETVSFAGHIVIIAHGRLVADGNIDETRALGEGALITATWPGLSEESLGQRLANCLATGSIGHAVVRGEHAELRTTDFDVVARQSLNAIPAEHLGTGATSLSEVFTALASDGSDETAPQRPKPHPSTRPPSPPTLRPHHDRNTPGEL